MRDRTAGGGRAGFAAVGRRKRSVARVLLQPGNGTIVVNGQEFEDRFPRGLHRFIIQQPLTVVNRAGSYNILVHVEGGGVTGQAGAIVQATARALVKADESMKPLLRAAGFLTRDPREKERKKYGLKRARKAPQYTKR